MHMIGTKRLSKNANSGGVISSLMKGGDSYICAPPYQFLLKSIVFEVCEYKYMNIHTFDPQLSKLVTP